MLGFLALLSIILSFSWLLCHAARFVADLDYMERCILVLITTLSYSFVVIIIYRLGEIHT